MIRLLSLLFFLSGAAGLLYETTWARYLGLFVGHEAYAQVLVLVIFLGGMAVGAWIVSRITARIERPLMGYALAEAAIGVAGLVFHGAFVGVTSWAYDAVFPALAGSAALGAVKWGLAALLILPQSIVLGATFPLMSAGVLRLDAAQPGRVVAQLYFTNSLGAAVGALVGGFFIIGAAGLPGAINVAAMLNLVVAAATVVLVVARRNTTAVSAPPMAPAVAGPGTSGLIHLLLAVSAGTAIASFAYEIDWIRMLALVLGAATHSFDLMLSAFILGLALGAWWTRRRADRFTDPLRALGTVQWIMGGLALATLPLYVLSFHWMAALLQGLAKSDGGYAAFSMAKYGICLAVMLPATFCAGITLPLITRVLMVDGVGERAIGSVYAVNTLGSIVGAALAGLVALPLLGLKGTLVAGATIDMTLGVVLLHIAGRKSGASGSRDAVVAAIATVAAAGFVLLTPPLDLRLLTSGVFRYGSIPDPGAYETIFYRDGRTATVSVGRTPGTDEKFIATNGKADASLPAIWTESCVDSSSVALTGDPSTQTLLAVIPLAYAPRARNVATIGMGSGMTSSLLLGSPNIEHLTTVEIEPNMIAGARLFRPANAAVFDDPRSRIVVADAKSFFASAGQTYDLIVSEPSNPWVSGVATLFSVEFYQRVRRYLGDAGIFAQWFHLYDLNDDLVLTVLAALHQSFPSYSIFLVDESDIVVVAGNRPLGVPDWSVTKFPGLAGHLCHFLPLTPATLAGTRIASRTELAPLLDTPSFAARANSDFYPRLDLGAERSRFMGDVASGISRLSSARFSLTAPFVNARVLPGTELAAPLPNIPRVKLLALGAKLHRPATEPDPDAGTNTARFRLQQWNAFMNGSAPPTDWHLWTAGFSEVEHDLGGGTQGVADEDFYRAATRFAERTHAPPEVLAPIRFRHGMAAWDFNAALAAAEVLLPGTEVGDDLVPADELRDGAVIAALRLGDAAKADRFYRLLQGVSKRDSDDLRTYMLDAYLAAGLRAAAGQGERAKGH